MKIKNECKRPPSALLWQIKRSIRWIYPVDFEGIHCLTLIDELSPVKERSPAWYKEARKYDHIIGGWYKAESRTPATITLNIKDIYRCLEIIIGHLLQLSSLLTL